MFFQRNYLKIFCFIAALNFLILIANYAFKFGYGNGSNGDISKAMRKWHDESAIRMALSRSGLGEVGVAADFDEYRSRLYKEYGYDAVLSDQISINRSVPDVRPAECKSFTYLAELPKASIIIIFFNERRSVLLRTVYGIINRSPDELIHEIILVDDFSTYEEVQSPLTEYLRINLPPERSKVRLVRSPKRVGLMAARMVGARAASKDSKALIFMDAHFEVNYNWLPPLLEPIALNPKACTSPEYDRIFFKNFKYEKSDPFRGIFDWTFNYFFYKLHNDEYKTPAKNRQEYVLMGAAIAIGTDFFWELGGFDEGMQLWGGEQFELSFKIWMCGGEIITVPCSRMAHLFRDPNTKGNTNLYGNYYFLKTNYRRFVDIWVDNEYREIIFHHLPELKTRDPGNLSYLLAVRDRLHCKSFSWMMDNIMPDVKTIFPPIEPNNLATGQVRSVLDPTLCISVIKNRHAVLEPCSSDKPLKGIEHWIYNWRGEIRTNGGICLESDLNNNAVSAFSCHITGGNQRWYYDREKQWIIQLKYKQCMAADVKENRVKLFVCDENNAAMKWTLSNMNLTEMDAWDEKLKKNDFDFLRL